MKKICKKIKRKDKNKAQIKEINIAKNYGFDETLLVY